MCETTEMTCCDYVMETGSDCGALDYVASFYLIFCGEVLGKLNLLSRLYQSFGKNSRKHFFDYGYPSFNDWFP